jgi:hypothetical protein
MLAGLALLQALAAPAGFSCELTHVHGSATPGAEQIHETMAMNHGDMPGMADTGSRQSASSPCGDTTEQSCPDREMPCDRACDAMAGCTVGLFVTELAGSSAPQHAPNAAQSTEQAGPSRTSAPELPPPRA